ncbi:isoprenoid synthase domain-containing protein [Boletus edulis BED1]|uniref:Isoprenoid synthase domain-containing protein n=1 Tax=Boletus edulis BED1 TaxID=1328754 RepID=A0AAD4GGA6_BOLED|nr:isoprenoid synthase domain-containing protein [Boletus edulis BED1]
MQLIQAARENIGSLLEQCNVPYKIIPFDEHLYQDCVDDATRRGYLVDGDQSVLTFLREGVVYAATAGAHIPHRPTQIWIALYTSCAIYVDEAADLFPEVLPDVYLFNDRFICKETQGNGVLDAFADVMRRASDLYRPVAAPLIITATQNFVTANLLEYETRSMKISSAAERYPIFQRTLSGVAEAYAFMVFPWEIPLNDYIQAIPEMTLFIHNVNDVLSFYKEELVSETTNQVSTLAARANKSKLETFGELTERTIGLYKTVVKILEGSPEACEAFKRYTAGYVYFHTSIKRYRFADLDLWALC